VSRDIIKIEGTIVEVTPGQKHCRVELPNGHRVLGFLAGKNAGASQLAAGEKVTLEMSPFDFSKGRIILNSKN
jgi:translation initiation factor IF-1